MIGEMHRYYCRQCRLVVMETNVPLENLPGLLRNAEDGFWHYAEGSTDLCGPVVRDDLLSQIDDQMEAVRLRRRPVDANFDAQRLAMMVRAKLHRIGDVRLERDEVDGGWVAFASKYPEKVGRGSDGPSAVRALLDAISVEQEARGGEEGPA